MNTHEHAIPCAAALFAAAPALRPTTLRRSAPPTRPPDDARDCRARDDDARPTLWSALRGALADRTAR